jgi:hypothetical protein
MLSPTFFRTVSVFRSMSTFVIMPKKSSATTGVMTTATATRLAVSIRLPKHWL